MLSASPNSLPAATVVLLRSGLSGLEVLLTRRPLSMVFAPDMYVFPGGRVDPDDGDPALAARSVRSAADAAMALGGDLDPDVALATHIAAIRELFEEAGVLLADCGADLAAIRPRLVSEARSALVGGEATFGSVASELDLRLRTDWLVPLSRWVTPPTFSRRFDARFFAATLPEGARASFEGDEVVDHAWMTPMAGLAAMAKGEMGLLPPTAATLQQLEHVASIAEIRERLVPAALASIKVETISPEVTRIVMPAGGGVAGQPVCAYLVGYQQHVLIDPGDPTGPALDRAIALAADRGGTIVAVALTQVDADHAGGAGVLAEVLKVPVVAGLGGSRTLPYAIEELADEAFLIYGDVALRAISTPGPSPHHLAFLVGDSATYVICGDLDGRHGARAVVGPWDDAAAAVSRDRLRALAPEAVWLTGHPTAGSPREG